MSDQLVKTVDEWAQKAQCLLAKPGHGIPSVSDISKSGRRVQDNNNLIAQLDTDRVKTVNLTRTVVTVDMVAEEAKRTALSNDRVMRLGEERLQIRIKITEMSTQRFWKELHVPADSPPYRFIMNTAWKSFPRFHQIGHRRNDAGPDHSKTKVMKNVGVYLTRANATSKLICEFMY